MHTLAAAFFSAAALEILLVVEEAGTVGFIGLLGVLVAVSVQVVRENSRTTEEDTNVGAVGGRGEEEEGREGERERERERERNFESKITNKANTTKCNFLIYTSHMLHTFSLSPYIPKCNHNHCVYSQIDMCTCTANVTFLTWDGLRTCCQISWASLASRSWF